jgi:lysophospholipase L1-like esterase
MMTGVSSGGVRVREWVLRIVLVLASLIVAGVVIEAGFRVARGAPWYERLEQEQTRLPVRHHRVGERTFKVRAPLGDEPKPTGVFRILFLGDSFTYGSGVADAGRVFPNLVAERLGASATERGPARYEVFNGGVPGSLTGKWVDLYEAAVDRYEGDLVVAVFFLRDGTSGIGGSGPGIRRVGEQMAELAERSWLFRHSYTYRYFTEQTAQDAFSREYLASMETAFTGDPEQTGEWRRARENLLRIRDDASRRGAGFALVVFPVLFDLGADYPLEGACREVERFAERHGIPVLSLLPAFRGMRAESLWVSPLDQHPNERAHAIAAEAIAEFLAPLIDAAGETGNPSSIRIVDFEERLPAVQLGRHGFTVVVHKQRLTWPADAGQEFNPDDHETAAAFDVRDDAGNVLFSYDVVDDPRELDPSRVRREGRYLFSYSVRPRLLKGSSGEALMIDWHFFPAAPSACSTHLILGLVDGKLTPFGEPFCEVIRPPRGVSAEVWKLDTQETGEDILEIRRWTGYYSIVLPLRVALSTGRLLPPRSCRETRAAAEGPGLCELPVEAYRETPPEATTVTLFPLPDREARPQSVVVQPYSRVQFVSALLPIHSDERGNWVPSPTDRIPWLKVRIEDRVGWVRTETDLLALGLRPAG